MLPISDENPTSRAAIVTALLIALNVAVFFLVQPQSRSNADVEFTYRYAAIPCEVVTGQPLTLPEIAGEAPCRRDGGAQVFPGKGVWRAALYSMFLHANLVHLGGNLLFLWIFGNNVEDRMGRIRYLLFYLAGGFLATIGHVAVGPGSVVPVVGASGAVAAVMGAYLVSFPRARVRTLVILGFLPLLPRLPAAILLAIWFVSQFAINPESGVAWVAHVAGFAYGAIYAVANRRLDVRRQRRAEARY